MWSGISLSLNPVLWAVTSRWARALWTERLTIFLFTDPMTLQPHDTDVKALTRLAGVENIVFCCNRSTADHIISSPLFVDPTYERTVPDYSNYTKRFANKPVVAEAVESAKKRKRQNKDETRFYWAFLIYRYPSFMDSPH